VKGRDRTVAVSQRGVFEVIKEEEGFASVVVDQFVVGSGVGGPREDSERCVDTVCLNIYQRIDVRGLHRGDLPHRGASARTGCRGLPGGIGLVNIHRRRRHFLLMTFGRRSGAVGFGGRSRRCAPIRPLLPRLEDLVNLWLSWHRCRHGVRSSMGGRCGAVGR